MEKLYRDSDKTVQSALRALGFYEPVIDKTLQWQDDCWLVELAVDPGLPVVLRNVSINVNGPADLDPDFRSRLNGDRPKPGDVFHHGRYSAYKAAMTRAAVQSGYFEAEFEQARVTVDVESRSADLYLQLDSGPKYRFSEVRFTPGILRDNLLRGYTDIRAGDPYAARPINELYESLRGSGYFAGVSIVTEPLDTEAKTVPLDVRLTASKRRVYTAGVGFTTDQGPHGKLGYSDRRINDRGHQFESRLYLSPVESELNTSYRWPRKDPRKEWFSVVAGVQHVETDTNEHDKFSLGLLRSKDVGNSWLETRYVNFERENFVVADQNTSSQLIIIGSNWEKAVGRALSRATNGYRLNFDIRGASDALGSDTSFLQFQTRARWIHSFNDKTRVLARTFIGTTAKDKLTELPASVRFFAGGDRSVRGYEYQSLGPVDDDGDVIGGSHQVDASIEIDRLIRDKWSIAAFVDSGSAFNSSDFDLSTGVGIGVRWYSPVGPVRLDFAHPLDDPNDSFRIHISLGPDL